MLTKNIIRFSGLLEKVCPLLEEAGFEVTGIEESVKRDPVTSQFMRTTGEFTICIRPKSEEESLQKS